jgi:hypothetical protein
MECSLWDGLRSGIQEIIMISRWSKQSIRMQQIQLRVRRLHFNYWFLVEEM